MTAPADRFIRTWCALVLAMLAAYVGLVVATSWRPGQDYLGALTLPEDEGFHAGPWGFEYGLVYHGIGSMTRHLQAADIVFFGHSRFYYGLDSRTIADFSERHGVRVFSLAMPAETGGEFPLRVMERHHVRPRLIVINADDDRRGSFFLDEPTPMSRGVLEATRLGTHAGILFQNHVSRRHAESFPVYRSVRDGTVHFVKSQERWNPGNPVLTHVREAECRASVDEYPAARDYVRRLRDVSPDAIIVLTLVPHPQGCPRRVRELALALGVPFVYAEPAGLTVSDGTHLDEGGAKAYTAELLRQLEGLEGYEAISLSTAIASDQHPSRAGSAAAGGAVIHTR